MPAVSIEAGLAACPFVGAAVGAIPEVVADGVTGILTTATAAAAAATEIGTAIARIVDDPAMARRMGMEARAGCVERFAIDAVAARWNEVLLEVAPLGDGRR